MSRLQQRADSNPWVATILSFVVPGLGLAYLGKVGWGLVNLAAVAAAAAAGAAVFPAAFWEHAHYAALAFAAGSAGLAHAVALRGRK
jgi:hypothetical protein